MRFAILLFLLFSGCTSVQAPDTLEQRKLNACFLSNEQTGWVPLEQPPENATELKALAVSHWPKSGAFDGRYEQIWFRHSDGRLLACSLFPVGNLPAVCGSMKYEFTHTNTGWLVQEGNLVICHERVR